MSDWRARIGVLFPGNSIVDRELWQWVPDGVTVHVNRLGSVETLNEPYTAVVALARSRSSQLEAATENLRIVGPTCVTYACTSGSFVGGVGHDRAIIERLAPIARVPEPRRPRRWYGRCARWRSSGSRSGCPTSASSASACGSSWRGAGSRS